MNRFNTSVVFDDLKSRRLAWFYPQNWSNKAVRKRKSQPISRVLSRAAIHLGVQSPERSSNLPGSRTGRASASLFDLAPDGVYPATTVASCAVRSYRTISPLPLPFVTMAVYFLWHLP